MLTLYVKTGCPYCAHVLQVGEVMGISFNEKNVADPGVADELVVAGGLERTPFLIDDETGKSMYGSDVIIDYLHERFR